MRKRNDQQRGTGASERAPARDVSSTIDRCLVVAVFIVAWQCAGAAAPAQTPPAPTLPAAVERHFTTADLDRSRTLTIEEAVKSGYSSETFEAIDRDRDRIITLYEVATYLGERAQVWQRADTDRDGSVSRSEAAASAEMKEAFDKADRDADGIVRQQEHEAWSQTTLYQNTELPVVVPNIINKKF